MTNHQAGAGARDVVRLAALEGVIIPITAIIIVTLFSVQRRGTAVVGRIFGPVMIAWFLAIAACGIGGITHHPDILKALLPHLRPGLPARPLRHRVLRPGRDRARGHRRRSALRRHGPLRPARHHPRLAHPRLPRVRAVVHGPGRTDPGRPGTHQQPVLPARPKLGTPADGPAGHRRHRDRLPGRDHRRLLGRLTSRPARLPAPAAHRAHLRIHHGPDLPS